MTTPQPQADAEFDEAVLAVLETWIVADPKMRRSIDPHVQRDLAAIHAAADKLVEARVRSEITNLGGATVHNGDVGGLCRKVGPQFRECLQCIKDDRLAALPSEEAKPAAEGKTINSEER